MCLILGELVTIFADFISCFSSFIILYCRFINSYLIIYSNYASYSKLFNLITFTFVTNSILLDQVFLFLQPMHFINFLCRFTTPLTFIKFHLEDLLLHLLIYLTYFCISIQFLYQSRSLIEVFSFLLQSYFLHFTIIGCFRFGFCLK